MRPNSKLYIYLKHKQIFFVIMCCNAFNVRPKTTLLPVWSRDAKSLDTPVPECFLEGQHHWKEALHVMPLKANEFIAS